MQQPVQGNTTQGSDEHIASKVVNRQGAALTLPDVETGRSPQMLRRADCIATAALLLGASPPVAAVAAAVPFWLGW